MKAVMMLASVVRECLSWCSSYKYPECVGDERGLGGGRCIRWRTVCPALRRKPKGGVSLADYPALSVDRAGGGNPLYAEDTPIQEFLNWCVTNQVCISSCML